MQLLVNTQANLCRDHLVSIQHYGVLATCRMTTFRKLCPTHEVAMVTFNTSPLMIILFYQEILFFLEYLINSFTGSQGLT